MTEYHVRDNISDGICHFEPRIFEWYTSTQFFNIDGFLRSDLSYLPIEQNQDKSMAYEDRYKEFEQYLTSGEPGVE